MKKLNKLFAILVAMAMVLSMGIIAAFAEDGETPTEPAQQTKTTTAPVTKTLTVPHDTAIPANADAKFTFVLSALNGSATEATDTEKAFISSPKDLPLATGGQKTPDTANNVDVYTYTINDVLAGIQWARPGIYEWDVEESAFTADDGNNATTDVLNKSKAKYKMVVKVVYKDGQLVVDEVIIKSGTDGDQGTTYTTADGLNFANSYYTTTGNPGTPDPEDPDKPVVGPVASDSAGLSLKKVVTGDLGATDKKFDIKLTVNLPQIDEAATATAVIRRANGTVDAQAITNGDNIIKLAHNDTLVFTKIAEGTTYTVLETDSAVGTESNQYKVTYDANQNGVVTKAANGTVVTNNLDSSDVTPTGILINNLPYIALALVAIGGLVAYVVVRRRQSDEA